MINMKFGSYEIPEVRLKPNCIEDIKKIYDNVNFQKITSQDLSKLFGYSNATSGRFYIRLKSLMSYGLLQGGNVVTQLGYQIAYPEPDQEDHIRKQAIFNITLWKELYKQIQDSPPTEFWITLKNVANVDAPTAQKHAGLIKKWYLEDISGIPKKVLDSNVDSAKSLRSGTIQTNSLYQQMQTPKMTSSDNVEVLSFDKYQIALPKGDLKKEWEKLKKYMDIKLEDYVYKESEVKFEDLTTEDQEIVRDIQVEGNGD